MCNVHSRDAFNRWNTFHSGSALSLLLNRFHHCDCHRTIIVIIQSMHMFGRNVRNVWYLSRESWSWGTIPTIGTARAMVRDCQRRSVQEEVGVEYMVFRYLQPRCRDGIVRYRIYL